MSNHHKLNGAAPLTNSKRYAHIVGWGKYLPETIRTNDDIAKLVDTSDEWIQQRTGIRERRIADAKETASTMALNAAKEALWVADISPNEVELVIVATSTPDYIFPATASLVQDALGASRAGAFDLSAACSGFVYALALGSAMIQSGTVDNALIIGSEVYSRIVDWTDRGTCILFGDGAGAFVLKGSDSPGGVLSYKLGSDGSGADLLLVPGGGSKNPMTQEMLDQNLQYVKMDGQAVFKFATRVLGKAAKEACEEADIALNQIDLLIPHQANLRIIAAASKALNLPDEKVMVNLQKYGNTSAASVPIAFCEAIEEKRLKPGDNVVLVSFGGGLSWAAAAVKFDPVMPPEKRTTMDLVKRWFDYNLASARSVVSHTRHRLDGALERARNRMQNRIERRKEEEKSKE
jgi:3-oxoacyl-[acyl-carrier-protein] synthase-3